LANANNGKRIFTAEVLVGLFAELFSGSSTLEVFFFFSNAFDIKDYSYTYF
jgi:hypothetical protein